MQPGSWAWNPNTDTEPRGSSDPDLTEPPSSSDPRAQPTGSDGACAGRADVGGSLRSWLFKYAGGWGGCEARASGPSGYPPTPHAAHLGCFHPCRPLYPPCPQTRHSTAGLNVALKDLTPSIPSSGLRSAPGGVRRSVGSSGVHPTFPPPPSECVPDNGLF